MRRRIHCGNPEEAFRKRNFAHTRMEHHHTLKPTVFCILKVDRLKGRGPPARVLHLFDKRASSFRQESFILSQESFILSQESFILSQESFILSQESFILSQESFILSQESFILSARAIRPFDKRASSFRKRASSFRKRASSFRQECFIHVQCYLEMLSLQQILFYPSKTAPSYMYTSYNKDTIESKTMQIAYLLNVALDFREEIDEFDVG